jgi:hypothetical protein
MGMSRTITGIASAAAVVTALALGVVAHVSTPRTAPASGAHTAHAGSAYAAAARAALLEYMKNSKPGGLIVRPSGLGPGHAITRNTTCTTTSPQCAFNWSGYASTATTKQEYSAVFGSWTVPTATCTAEQELSSQWVGLDGFATSTVEQVGTLEFCFEGKASYSTWYEMYPNGSVTVGQTVKPGDAIAAKVVRSGTSYTLALTDSTTTGNNVSATKTCAAATCLDESAEWIDERPAYATTGITPLADASNWNLSGGNTIAGGKTDTIAASPGLVQINMVDSTGTYSLVTTGALSSTGKGFTVKWLNSY